jgi:dTMP kinase
MNAPRPGRFITLEGGEGAGKSSLARALGRALGEKGVSVALTREPGGTPAADEIRALLLRGGEHRWSVLSEALLFAAARNDHLERLIRPALAAGQWVLCDRYMDSTAAYQVAGRRLPRAVFDDLHRIISADRPDLTLILDLDPDIGVRRSRGGEEGEDRYENMDRAFHARVREGFRAIAAAEPDRCVLIDASAERAVVLRAAMAAIETRLGTLA